MIQKVTVTTLVICSLSAGWAEAQFVDFSAQLADAENWTLTAFGSALTASFHSNFDPDTDGDGAPDLPLWRPTELVFSDAHFVEHFGPRGQALQMFTMPDQPLVATRVDFNIDRPFPENARLIVMDLDGIRERVRVVSQDGAIGAPISYETVETGTSELGASSFPRWNPELQLLESSFTKQNDREASVFDIRGLTHFALTLAGHRAASSWYAITTVVPEPTAASLFAVGLFWLGRVRRDVRRT